MIVNSLLVYVLLVYIRRPSVCDLIVSCFANYNINIPLDIIIFFLLAVLQHTHYNETFSGPRIVHVGKLVMVSCYYSQKTNIKENFFFPHQLTSNKKVVLFFRFSSCSCKCHTRGL